MYVYCTFLGVSATLRDCATDSCTCMHTCVYECMRMHVDAPHVHVCMCMHVIHIHAYIYTYIYNMCTHAYVCMYTNTHMFTHMCTYTSASSSV